MSSRDMLSSLKKDRRVIKPAAYQKGKALIFY